MMPVLAAVAFEHVASWCDVSRQLEQPIELMKMCHGKRMLEAITKFCYAT